MTEQTSDEPDEPEAAADDATDVSDAVDDDAGDDDAPTRDADAQAEVDEVSKHSTTLRDSASEGTGESQFRTPPGIPGGLDPKTLADRDK